ncbi:MAG: hypothetical protein ACWGNV_09910 [Bacteroidales bacterium]
MSKQKEGSSNKIIHYLLQDDGIFPNNPVLPLIIHVGAFPVDGNGKADPGMMESVFTSHQWRSSWRNGLYTMHHYHSTAHEALGIYSGMVRARIGGEIGPEISASAGDVVIIPAGVAHKNLWSSQDFRVVGAYPEGQTWDMNYGREGERPRTDRNILGVPLPALDPVAGNEGPLMEMWGLV